MVVWGVFISFSPFGLASTVSPPSTESFQWTDADQLVIEGKGWPETEELYDRLPRRAKGVVREAVWDLGKHSSGIRVRFRSDASAIAVRWSLSSLRHFLRTGRVRTPSGYELSGDRSSSTRS